jgi:DNA mismatch repair protein MutS2
LSEPPETREIRLETEAALECGSVCTRLADFTATVAGHVTCGERRVPVGQSQEQSEKLIE